jgi:hypothetical protein
MKHTITDNKHFQKRKKQMQELKNLIEKNGLGNGCLVGLDGNAFSLIGYTSQCLRRKGWSRKDIQTFQQICMSSDYQNVINTCYSVLDDNEDEADCL